MGHMRGEFYDELSPRMNAPVHACFCAKFISRRGFGIERDELMLNVTARQDLMNKIVETLGVVVEDARFEFKENQMQATVVDASHVL